jgi:hypothetical protein
VPALRSVDFPRRSRVDYALARRAVLADLFAGRVSPTEVCDAHPYLLRAARYYGEVTSIPCPVCRRECVHHVAYTYGDDLGAASGRARNGAELAALAREYSDVSVYVVEVCRSCGWNHLVTSYVIGSGAPRKRRSSRGRAAQE